MEQIRLNKFLSEAGICSRREADRWIAAGRVSVNGRQAPQTGCYVSKTDQIEVDGKPVHAEEEKILLALYKPRGIVCTAEKREKDNIIEYLNYPKRVTYAGRLDKESEGLILMTNQGHLIQEMMRAGNEHEKEYIVTVNKPVTEAFIETMRNGIWLEELQVKTRRCTVEKKGEKSFRIILTQGLNRQIRRMCQACGYHVRKLVRVRIMNIQLGDLKNGSYRKLTPAEIRTLYKSLGMKE